MTCIAACTHRGRVWLAADSALSDAAGDVMYTGAPKAWVTPAGLVVGAAGDATYLDALARIEWPARLEDAGPTLRAVFGPDPARTVPEGQAILGWRGDLFFLDQACIIPIDDTIAACGSGTGYAMGALAASKSRKPDARVRLAVEIAARYSTSVGGKVVVVCA
jgi:hypothetical protein